jgi:hypothetical protein
MAGRREGGGRRVLAGAFAGGLILLTVLALVALLAHRRSVGSRWSGSSRSPRSP